MIRNFGSEVAGKVVSMSWVERFLHRHQDLLLLRWGPSLDRVRHQADSVEKYNSYFDILHQKMEEYKIQRRLSYNMDEKGLMIGVEAKSKRVFSKTVWVKDGARAPIQDGNRAWITLLLTICGDGTTLPTSIIYPSEAYDLWDSWVDDIPPDEKNVIVSSTPTGWTNDRLGLAWLQRFDQYTKKKARQAWRLLICDGHGSHVTMEFLAYATKNRILVMVFPSRSTPTLQPLDVGIFGPFQSYYSSELARIQQQSQGLLRVKKADFYTLFKSAYTSAFTENNILSAFKATGIWPMDRTIVTNKFDYTTPPEQTDKIVPSHLSPADWNRVQQLLVEAVKEGTVETVKKLLGPIHRASPENKLLKLKNEGLLASLDTKNKRTRHSRRLLFPGSKKRPTDAAFYSPRKVEEARAIQRKKDKEKRDENTRKQTEKKQNTDKRAEQRRAQEEKRIERERQKGVKEKEKADKALEAERKKAAQEEAKHQKSIPTSQKGKRNASKALPKQRKRQKRVGGGAASSVAPRAASPEPSRTTSRGRTITLPSKFK
jgi:hypothetical protein